MAIVEGEEDEAEAKLPVLPVVLDEPKSKIKKNIVKVKQPEF